MPSAAARLRALSAEHRDQRESLVDASADVAGQMWAEINPDRIVDSWAAQVPELTGIVTGAQLGAARTADRYVGSALSEQGLDDEAVSAIDPAAFAGVPAEGGSLEAVLASPAFQVLTSIPLPGMSTQKALAEGRVRLETIVRTEVADAGRLADQASLVAHPAAQGYIRQTDGNPCSRCLVLAGRFYLWNRGFQRHLRCNCVHVPASQRVKPQDPRSVFDAMSTQERLRAGFSPADIEAIENGADIGQVINAKRVFETGGVYVPSVYRRAGREFTVEGTTRRGFARSRLGPGQPRLTPNQIFLEASSRDEALQMLYRNGYLIEMPRPVVPPTPGRPLPSGRPRPSQRPLPDRPLRGLGDEASVAPVPGVGTGGTVTHIADLPRVPNPEDRLAQAMATNPHYGQPYRGPITPALVAEIERGGAVGYSQNCTRVAIAHEMRRRGIDVTAGAGTSIGDTTAAYVRTFRTAEGRYPVRVAEDLSRNMSAREVVAEVETWPLGSRGIVTVRGHTLNVERDAVTGRAVFIDAQAAAKKNPVMDSAAFQRRMKSRGAPTDRGMAVTRVDDLELSDYGLRYVESPELDITRGQVGRSEYPAPKRQSRGPSTFDQMRRLKPDDTYTGPRAGRRTATDLRAAVTERGITVPTGLRVADLERLVADLERGVAPATARETAVRAILEERAGVGRALAQAAEMAGNNGSSRALQALGRQIRRDLSADQVKTARVLLEGLDAGDLARVRAALPVVARGAKLKPVGEAGAVLRLDSARMTRIGAGGADDVVRVVRPGFETTFEHKTITVLRADVLGATPEQAARLAPVKAAKPPAGRIAIDDVLRLRHTDPDALAAWLEVTNLSRLRSLHRDFRIGEPGSRIAERGMSGASGGYVLPPASERADAAGLRVSFLRQMAYREDGDIAARLKALADDIERRATRAAKATPAKKVAAPKAPPAPAKMTAPALRKELQPIVDAAPGVARLDLAGVPQPVLAKWTERARELPPSKLAEEVGRWRQGVVDRRRAVADALSEAAELLDNGASAATLGLRARNRLARVEKLVAGWPDEAALRSLVTAMQTGNPAQIRRAIKAAQKKVGLEQVGVDAGKLTKYDPKVMSPIGGKIPTGADVIVVRPGYSVTVGSERVVLSKPVVEVASPVDALPRLDRLPAATQAAKATNPDFGSTSGSYPYTSYKNAPQVGKSKRYTPDLGPLPTGAFEENCTNVVLAWDMRMRGFDIQAAPLDVLDRYGLAGGRLDEEIDDLLARAYRLADGKPHGRTILGQQWRSFDEIEREVLRDWPEGGRGLITVGKHVFNVMKRNGKMEFVEAQFDANASRIVTALYRRKYKGARWSGEVQEGKVIRLDDLVPADGILDSVRPV